MRSSLRLLAVTCALSAGLQAAQAQSPAGEAPPLAKVRINQVVGPPELAGELLHRELAASLARHRVAVAAGKDEPIDFYLRPYVLASIEQSGAKVSWVVDVADPTGRRMMRFSGEEGVPGASPDPDPWAAVTQPVARAFATEVASGFAAWRADNSK
jgi:hypothetical protein